MANAVPKRLVSQIEILKASTNKFILDASPLNGPSREPPYIILGRILPNSDIYNQAAFQIEIKLPIEYPFQPPEICFSPPIYHPNVDKDGKISLDILTKQGLHSATKTTLIDIVEGIIELIDHPQLDYPLDTIAASEYVNDKDEFARKASETVRQHGQARQ